MIRWLRAAPVWWWRLCSLVTAAVVLAMALMPLKMQQSHFEHADKVMHAFTFAVITVMALLGWRRRPLLVVMALLLYGAAIELLQGWTSYRTASVADIVADVFGIGLGMLLTRWLRLR